MIANIESFRPAWSVKARVTMGLLIALAFIVMPLLGTGVFPEVTSGITSALMIISAFAMVGYGVWQSGGIALQERNDYYEYLSGVDSNTLIKGTASAELSQDTRRTIIEYLNDTQPGWSFQAVPAPQPMARG